MSSKIIDIYVLYQIIKRISTPFDETDAFKLGLIDKSGKSLKKAQSSEEKKAMTLFDRFVFNIKRALSRVGLDSRVGTYAGALFLLRESERHASLTEDQIVDGVREMYTYLCENTSASYKDMFFEDAPAVSTGPAVAGTGDDPVHWRDMKNKSRKKRKRVSGPAIIDRINRRRENEVVNR